MILKWFLLGGLLGIGIKECIRTSIDLQYMIDDLFEEELND